MLNREQLEFYWKWKPVLNALIDCKWRKLNMEPPKNPKKFTEAELKAMMEEVRALTAANQHSLRAVLHAMVYVEAAEAAGVTPLFRVLDGGRE